MMMIENIKDSVEKMLNRREIKLLLYNNKLLMLIDRLKDQLDFILNFNDIKVNMKVQLIDITMDVINMLLLMTIRIIEMIDTQLQVRLSLLI